MNLHLTERDRDLLLVLSRARWLTTRQIHGHYFEEASLNACQKRLRKLAQASFLAGVRPSRMETQLWRLGTQGVQTLRAREATAPSVPKRIPGNREHFLTVNDLRLWFRGHFRGQGPNLSFFLAEWELKRGRQLEVIPDALVQLTAGERSLMLALEVDLGTENPVLFARMKLDNYGRFETVWSSRDWYVVVLTSGWPRTKALIRRLYGHGAASRFVLSDVERFLTGHPDSAVLIPVGEKRAGSSAVCLTLNQLLKSPLGVSSREETLAAVSD